MERLPRLISILNILQSKKIVTATELADRFSVSRRTIYRDVRTLEEAGIPVLTETGKGFSLMDGYRLLPRTFTEEEASAIITVEQLLAKNADAPLLKNYGNAASKVKAVLHPEAKNRMELLASRIKIYPNHQAALDRRLTTVQSALANQRLVKLVYRSVRTEETTERIIEPFALFYWGDIWMLVAFCRIRTDYRIFRLDRMSSFLVLEETFTPHALTITKYLKRFKNDPIHP